MTLPTVASFLAKTRKSWDPAIGGEWPDTVIVPPGLQPGAEGRAEKVTFFTNRPPKDAKAEFLERLLGIA